MILTIKRWQDYEAFVAAFKKPHIAVRPISGPTSNPDATYWEIAFVDGDKTHSMMIGMPQQEEAVEIAKFIRRTAQGKGPILIYITWQEREKILAELDAETGKALKSASSAQSAESAVPA